MTLTMVALFTDRRSRAVFDEEIRIRGETGELVAQPTNPQTRLAFRYGDSEDAPFESQLETRTIGLLNRETGGVLCRAFEIHVTSGTLHHITERD